MVILNEHNANDTGGWGLYMAGREGIEKEYSHGNSLMKAITG